MRRTFGLDVLRAAAILVVLANHAYMGILLPTGHATWGGKSTAFSLAAVLSIEWLFVLSGFLIGAMMIRSFERGGTFWARAKSFWLRRWFRTVPNYYLFLLVNVVLVAAGLAEGHFSFLHAFFAQNLVHAEPVPFFFTEAWSLALDEWFYLAMPVLVGLMMLGRKPGPATVRNAFLAATATLILVPTALRYLGEIPHPDGAMDRLQFWDTHYRRLTVMHLDATGWGVLGAVTSRWAPQAWGRSKPGKALLGAALMAFGILTVEGLFWTQAPPAWLWDQAPRLTNAAGLAAMGLGTYLALPWLASIAPWQRATARPATRLVDRLSVTSYSIYLVHMPLQYLLMALLPAAAKASQGLVVASTALWIGVTFAVSALLYRGFEKPIADLRERFTRREDANPFTPTPVLSPAAAPAAAPVAAVTAPLPAPGEAAAAPALTQR